MKKSKTENNIDLGIEYNTGTIKTTSAPITQEEIQIEESRGRNEKDKDSNDSTISGIANFRIIGNNQ